MFICRYIYLLLPSLCTKRIKRLETLAKINRYDNKNSLLILQRRNNGYYISEAPVSFQDQVEILKNLKYLITCKVIK